MIPSTLKECFEALDIIIGAEDQEFIRNADEDEMVSQCHFGLGRWIRNNWGLWSHDSNLYRYFNNLGLEHPDDMSGVIMTSYWRHKHNQSLNLAEQIKYYQDYWDKQKSERSE